ncbi:hypothetical protein C7N43_31605 [Sphingobacteriales bacterium UPWRP_1]|nr:hypothetical protein BVG80_01590 [Sphingobacteriales bacterium TSM_CSM]PSJ72940.1 hypothetical protein C7N43_31605 [Sphingobacteriales bacterium UPWRP_1]
MFKVFIVFAFLKFTAYSVKGFSAKPPLLPCARITMQKYRQPISNPITKNGTCSRNTKAKRPAGRYR